MVKLSGLFIKCAPEVAILAGLACPCRSQISKPTAIILRLVSPGENTHARARAHKQYANAVKLERRRAARRFGRQPFRTLPSSTYYQSRLWGSTQRAGGVYSLVHGWDGHLLALVPSALQGASKTTSKLSEPLQPFDLLQFAYYGDVVWYLPRPKDLKVLNHSAPSLVILQLL